MHKYTGGRLSMIGFAVAGLLALPASAVNVPVGTVTDLVEALRTNKANTVVIQLAAGDYKLTDDICDGSSSNYGKSHLGAKNVRIKGMGATPEETRLIGAGTQYRVILLDGALIENLTVTNGYAKAQTGLDKSKRGGGVVGGTVTNCLVVGNRADAYGGGIAGGAKIYRSRILHNRSPHGGGIHSCKIYGSCVAGNQATNGNGGGIMTATEALDTTVISNTATSTGGGIYLGGIISNCTIVCNETTGGAGGGVALNEPASASFSNCMVINSVISNNVSSTGGGGTYAVWLSGCRVVGNRTSEYGGGVFQSGFITNCTIAGNTAAISGGGIANNASLANVCCDSIVSNNVAKSGGGVYLANLVRTDVSCNAAVNGDGGGLLGSDQVMSCATNCFIYGNVATNGIAHCFGGGGKRYFLSGCEVCGNTSIGTNGNVGCAGGVYMGALDGCYVHDNYSDKYGGGAREITATGTTFENNLSPSDGLNVRDVVLTDCTIIGTSGYGVRGERIVFRDLASEVTLANNPNISVVLTNKNVVNGHFNLTNCLVVNSRLTGKNDALFSGILNGSTTKSSLVNCTLVNNVYKNTFACFTNALSSLTVRNCLFFGNKRTDDTAADIMVDTGNVKATGAFIDHTAYGAGTTASFSKYFSVGASLCKFGAADGLGTVIGADPQFCLDDAKHPYSLKHASRARGRGVCEDWMADATDIRGEGYSRTISGSVDLGCYQCHLAAAGFLLFVR